MPLSRLERQITKGTLWLYILALLRERPIHAYEIKKEIKKRFDFNIGNVTAYLVLYRLEKTGHVKAEWMMRGGRQRKYYSITNKGRDTLKKGINFLDDTVGKLR